MLLFRWIFHIDLAIWTLKKKDNKFLLNKQSLWECTCLMVGKGAVNNVLDHLIYHTLGTKQHNGTLAK